MATLLDYNAAGQLIQFTATQTVSKAEHKMLWTARNPLLAVIKGANRANKGFTIAGNSIVMNVNLSLPETRAAGVLESAAFTPLTPAATTGQFKAQYPFTRIHDAFWLSPEEIRLIRGNPKEVDIVRVKTNKAMADMDLAIETMLQGVQNAAENTLLGPKYVASTTNTIGNISQSSYTYWQGVLRSGLGTFDSSVIDYERRRVKAKGRSEPDILLLSAGTNNDVYGKLKSEINAAQLLTTEKKKVSYGFTEFVWMDLAVFDDWVMYGTSAGSGLMLSSDAWYWGDDDVTVHPPERLEGTGSKEYYMEQFCVLGTDDPGANTYFTGWDA